MHLQFAPVIATQKTEVLRCTVPEPPHPHPAAPAEFKEAFSSFLVKFKASAMRNPEPVAASSAAPVSVAKQNAQVLDFWQIPPRLRSPALSEAEIEAITVCVYLIQLNDA